jgi:hypothetical protein
MAPGRYLVKGIVFHARPGSQIPVPRTVASNGDRSDRWRPELVLRREPATSLNSSQPLCAKRQNATPDALRHNAMRNAPAPGLRFHFRET